MKKVLVEALQNFPYDYADRKIGDQFECDEEHARVFNVHGKTKPVGMPRDHQLPTAKPAEFQTTSQKAEDSPTTEDTPESRRNKRYKRRDMRPEE